MTLATADFEAGTLGASVATTDWGNATPWDSVVTGAGSSIVYSNTQKYGRASGRYICTANPSYTGWTTGIGTLTDHYTRMYFYATTLPAGGQLLVQGYLTGVNGYRITINGGLLRLFNVGFSNIATSVTSITADKWWRFEWHLAHSGGALPYEVRIFSDADSAIPSETLSGTGSFGTSLNEVQFGSVSGTNAATTYLDGIVAGATTWAGPIVAPATVPGPPVLVGRSGSW